MFPETNLLCVKDTTSIYYPRIINISYFNVQRFNCKLLWNHTEENIAVSRDEYSVENVAFSRYEYLFNKVFKGNNQSMVILASR